MAERRKNAVKGSSVRELRGFLVLNDHHLESAAGKVMPPPLGSIWMRMRTMNCVQSKKRLSAANMNAQMRRGRRASNMESMMAPATAPMKSTVWNHA